MEESLKAKIGCKKIKPRRKFKCNKSYEIDCLILLKFMSQYERNQGREKNAEIMLSNGKLLPIDDIDIFDNPKKKKDDEV